MSRYSSESEQRLEPCRSTLDTGAEGSCGGCILSPTGCVLTGVTVLRSMPCKQISTHECQCLLDRRSLDSDHFRPRQVAAPP